MATVIIDDVPFEYINNELIIDALTPALSYDAPYLETYKKLAHTLFSIRLCQWRRAYAESWGKSDDDKFLDFGCGYSPLIEKIYFGDWTEDLGDWYGTDINEAIGEMEHMLMKWVDPNHIDLGQYDVVCFFDVVEHLRNYKDILSQIGINNVIVITVPCWEKWNRLDIYDITNWRHYKPGEHFLYGSVKGWQKEICSNGFELINCTDFESSLGRLDSWTMTFRKVK